MSSSNDSLVAIKRFGQKLRALRAQRALTLQQLANLLGLNAHGYISELERGKKLPTAEMVLKVARLFDVTTDYLLKDELDMPLQEGIED